MNLEDLLSTLASPIVIRPTRRMTKGELERYVDKAADILRGKADHSEFRGYVFALLFYKRISDCFDEGVRTQVGTLFGTGYVTCSNRITRRASGCTSGIFEPRADSLHGRMRDAWKAVPAWAQRGTGLLL